jgi:hypothetical protein
MRWLAWVTILCACDGYRPIAEIDKVECNGAHEVEVYGSVDVNGESLDFDDAFFPPQDYAFGRLFIQDGNAQLYVDPAGAATVTLESHRLAATSARVATDCPNGGRFEAHFATGDLSGWWIGGFSGW